MNDSAKTSTKVETRSTEEVLEDIDATSEDLMTVVENDTENMVYATPITSNRPSNTSSSVNVGDMGIGLIVVVIISLILALVAFFTITMKKKSPRGKFLKYMREFLNFRRVWIAGILKFIYLFLALVLTLGSIVMMFFGGDHVAQMIIICLLTLIFGNVLLRVIFEMTMITIGLWQNTNDMRAVLVKDEETPEEKEEKAEENKKAEEVIVEEITETEETKIEE